MVVVEDSTKSDPESYTAPQCSHFGSEYNLEWSHGGRTVAMRSRERNKRQIVQGQGLMVRWKNIVKRLQEPVKHHKMNHCPPEVLAWLQAGGRQCGQRHEGIISTSWNT